jgi:hypothetical protein
MYAKAQLMVANGDGVNGRKLADSVAAAAKPGSAAFAEGLFWRATLAADARDAEHEYRQIIVDYPLSGRVPDALLRIGQLESARGENAAALQHFQRLVLEHPTSPLRAAGSYWVAQMYFETNDAARACAANADALKMVRQSNVELKNRIDFQRQRCRGVALASNTGAGGSDTISGAKAPAPATQNASRTETRTPPAASVPSAPSPPLPTPIRSTTGNTARITAPESASKSASKSVPVTDSKPGAVTRAPTAEEVSKALESANQPALTRAAREQAARKAAAAAAGSSLSRSGTAAVKSSSAAASPTASPGGPYAVQVAAFSAKGPADLFAAKLRKRGYDAYVDGSKAPFRARLGHYPTHAAAAAALARLKAVHIDGFVVKR